MCWYFDWLIDWCALGTKQLRAVCSCGQRTFVFLWQHTAHPPHNTMQPFAVQYSMNLLAFATMVHFSETYRSTCSETYKWHTTAGCNQSVHPTISSKSRRSINPVPLIKSFTHTTWCSTNFNSSATRPERTTDDIPVVVVVVFLWHGPSTNKCVIEIEYWLTVDRY